MKKVLKYMLIYVIIISAVLSVSMPVLASPGNMGDFLMNSKVVECDVAPFIRDGEIMLPFRAVFENMGMTVDWDEKNKIAYAEYAMEEYIIEIAVFLGEKPVSEDDKEIDMQISVCKLFLNMKLDLLTFKYPVYLEKPAEVVKDRTFVPSGIAEKFEITIHWDDKKETAVINTENSPLQSKSVENLIYYFS